MTPRHLEATLLQLLMWQMRGDDDDPQSEWVSAQRAQWLIHTIHTTHTTLTMHLMYTSRTTRTIRTRHTIRTMRTMHTIHTTHTTHTALAGAWPARQR